MNFAYNQPAGESTIDHWNGTPNRAVDGGWNPVFQDGSVTHTAANGTYPWWAVDLGSDTRIVRVDVINREKYCKLMRLISLQYAAIETDEVTLGSLHTCDFYHNCMTAFCYDFASVTITFSFVIHNALVLNLPSWIISAYETNYRAIII